MVKIFRKVSIVLAVFFVFGSTSNAEMWKKGQLVRDAQVEWMLLKYLMPIYEVAGLDQKLVRPFIIIDDSYNAFATIENMVVAHSGFLMKVKSPEEMAFVMGHEVGHQSARHIVRRFSGEVQEAMSTMVVGALAGGALAVLTGKPEVAMGGLIISNSVAMANFNAHSRTAEREADNRGILYMKKLSWPVYGAKLATEAMQDMDREYGAQNRPIYLRSHPYSADRLAFAKDHLNPGDEVRTLPEHLRLAFFMALARIRAMTMDPQDVLDIYRSEKTPQANYARAIVNMHLGKIDQAAAGISDLITKFPSDPFLHSTLGEVYIKGVQFDKALNEYNLAINLAEGTAIAGIKKNAAILRFERAELLAMMKKYEGALNELEVLGAMDSNLKSNAGYWTLMVRIYDGMGNEPMRLYAKAEESYSLRNKIASERYVEAALAKVQDKSSAEYVKMRDLRLKLNEDKTDF